MWKHSDRVLMVAVKTPVSETWAVTLESASPIVCACVESAWVHQICQKSCF